MAAAGYLWAGHEAEFEGSMLVASNAQQFADAVVSLSTNAAEWKKYSTGGLKLASTQSSSARFSADVLGLVSSLKLKSGSVAQSTIPFVAPSALRSTEQKLKSQNPFELMSGTGGSSSSGPEPEACGAATIQPTVGGLYGRCNCTGANCLTDALICEPSASCQTGWDNLLACRNAPAYAAQQQLQQLLGAYDAILSECGEEPSECAASTITAKVGGLYQTCQCSTPTDCITEAIVCTPSEACRAAGQALLDCRDAPAYKENALIQNTLKAYDDLLASCNKPPSAASTTSASLALAVAGAAAAVLAL
jgi:hypothetical protein